MMSGQPPWQPAQPQAQHGQDQQLEHMKMYGAPPQEQYNQHQHQPQANGAAGWNQPAVWDQNVAQGYFNNDQNYAQYNQGNYYAPPNDWQQQQQQIHQVQPNHQDHQQYAEHQAWDGGQWQQQQQQQQQQWMPPGQTNGEAVTPGAAAVGGPQQPVEEPINTGTGAASMQDIPLDDASANDESRPLFASSSFGKLPEQPSEFDVIGNNSGGSAALQASFSQPEHPAQPEGPSLNVAAQNSLAHSRQSSYGNVQFIVGSGSNSASQSASQSPHLFGNPEAVAQESKPVQVTEQSPFQEDTKPQPPQPVQQLPQQHQPSVAAAEVDGSSDAASLSRHSTLTDSMGAMGPGPIHFSRAASEQGSESSEVAGITQRIAPGSVDSGGAIPQPPIQQMHRAPTTSPPVHTPTPTSGAMAMTGPPPSAGTPTGPHSSSIGLPPPVSNLAMDNPFRRSSPHRRYAPPVADVASRGSGAAALPVGGFQPPSSPANASAAGAAAAQTGPGNQQITTPEDAQPSVHQLNIYANPIQPNEASPFQPLHRRIPSAAEESTATLDTSHTSITSSSSVATSSSSGVENQEVPPPPNDGFQPQPELHSTPIQEVSALEESANAISYDAQQQQQNQHPTSPFQQQHPTSPTQQQQHPIFPIQQQQHPTSPIQEQQHPISPNQQQQHPTFPIQQQHPTSPIQQQQHPTSPIQQEQHPTLPIQQQQQPTSPNQQQQHPTSPTQQQQHPTSPFQQQPPQQQNQQPTDPDLYKQSLAYQMHKNRAENNPSPVTTLWNNPPPRSPLTLAPAVPEPAPHVDPHLIHPQPSPVVIQDQFPNQEETMAKTLGFSSPPGGPVSKPMEGPPQEHHYQQHHLKNIPVQEQNQENLVPSGVLQTHPIVESTSAEGITLNSPNLAQAMPQTSQSLPSIPQSPARMNDTYPTMPQTPPTVSHASPNVAQTSPAVAQSPPLANQVNPSEPQSPPTMGQAPPTLPQAPPTMPQAPPTMQQAPPTMQQAPPPTSMSHQERQGFVQPPQQETVQPLEQQQTEQQQPNLYNAQTSQEQLNRSYDSQGLQSAPQHTQPLQQQQQQMMQQHQQHVQPTNPQSQYPAHVPEQLTQQLNQAPNLNYNQNLAPGPHDSPQAGFTQPQPQQQQQQQPNYQQAPQKQPLNPPMNVSQQQQRQLQPLNPPLNVSQQQQPLNPPLNVGQQQQPLNPPLNVGQQQQPLNPPLNVGQQQQPLNPPLNVGQQQQPLNPPLNVGQQQQPLNPPLNVSQQQLQPLNPPLNVGQQQQQPLNPPLNVSQQQQQPLNPPLNVSQQQQQPLNPTQQQQYQQLLNPQQQALNPPQNPPIKPHSRKDSMDSIANEINPPPPSEPAQQQQQPQSQYPPHNQAYNPAAPPNPSAMPQPQTDVQRQDSQRSDQSDPRYPPPAAQPQDPYYDQQRGYAADPRSTAYDPRADPRSTYYDPRYDPQSRYYDSRYANAARYRDSRGYDDRGYRGGGGGSGYYDQGYHARPSSRGYYDQQRYDEYYRSTSRQGYPEDDRQRQRPRSRMEEEYNRPRSRQGHPDAQRPSSRQGYPEGQERSSSRQGYPEGQERPKSRQGDPAAAERSSSRPSSRQGQPERPWSRSEYERSDSYHSQPRDYAREYYDRDSRYRDYSYEDYYRARAYYDDYYRDTDQYATYHQSRVDRAYEDEMKSYSSQYAGYDDYRGGSKRSDYDDRSSQHSQSRGTTPGPETGADQFAREFHQGSRPSSRLSGYEQSPIYRGGDERAHGYYQQSYDDRSYDPAATGYAQEEVQEPAVPSRLTPVRYSIPHMRVSFGRGCELIKVMPNNPCDGQPAIVELQVISGLVEDTSLTSFPGPLVKGDTHKTDVLRFCQQMASLCQADVNMVDRESATLVWRLLELLIKQNGTIVGTDISDLLLSGGHEPGWEDYSKPATTTTAAILPRPASTSGVDEGDAGAAVGVMETSALTVTSDRTAVGSYSKSMDELTERFRHLLLHGRKKDALEWAMKQNLWGHALFLASKMDPKTHASIMTRFANVSMKMNDPLQTLYQLMSGRQPAAVTLVADEKWGDWRPHLAIILSNHTSRPDLDIKSIITLGDTLASKGCLHASHFCYLMAQVPFGAFDKKASKIVLIGSNHGLPFKDFASNIAIQCTEVYEYAQSLGNAGFTLPAVQLYKFIYARRLADAGLAEEALHYLEVISHCLVYNPALYGLTLVNNVFALASQLKYSDPQRLHVGDEDMADPPWILHLENVVQGLRDGTISSTTPVGDMTQYNATAAEATQDFSQYNADQTGLPEKTTP